MNTTVLLGPGGIGFMGFYLALLILVGLGGRAARQEDSMADFYLSNRRLGPFVLFLTLYATQYSGLTLIGFVGNVYRIGYLALVSVTFFDVDFRCLPDIRPQVPSTLPPIRIYHGR